MKKRVIDQRQEPGSGSGKANRVDRVFVPAGVPVPRTREASGATQMAAELLATPRPGTDAPETELSLRRQLSRLQRQLSESQRELANKDDELAAEVEKRLQITRDLEEQIEFRRQMQERIDELLAYEARTAGVDQRLQETIATADELVQLNERERAATADALARVDELNQTFEETRQLWNAERKMIEERHIIEIAAIDAQRKAAVEASAEALNAQASRLREAHEVQLVEIRIAQDQSLAKLRKESEQSLSSLRADLAPKALQAHNLAEERERLIAELAAVRNEAIRDTVEREESYKREQQQASEAAFAELAALSRNHNTQLARVAAEKDAQIISLQKSVKGSETRAEAAEAAHVLVRETLKTVQREASELKERVAALESDRASMEEALERNRSVIETLLEEKRALHDQAEANADEARRNAMDRRRFVAYLEEGLALIGALPPKDDDTPKD